MYPFYVKGERILSFSYKPSVGDIIYDDDSWQWYIVEEVSEGRGRKVFGRWTVNPFSD